MSIFEIFNTKAKGKNINIGIGLGESKSHNMKILDASKMFLQDNKSIIHLFGNKKSITQLSKSLSNRSLKSEIILIESANPEANILNFLMDGIINAVIRGNLSSSKFLENLKEQLNVKDTYRLALLETFTGYQFFFGPVGIDECRDIEGKISFIEKAIIQLELLDLKPKISILSGGRIGDIGRDGVVDKSIKIAEEVVELFKQNNQKLEINHHEILIENAIENKSNLIIAPDGISGNLIYRTLVHLGGGKAYGAIYMGLDHIVIDTSRVGSNYEIYGGLLLCLALTS